MAKKFPQRRPDHLNGGRPKEFDAKIELLVTEHDKQALTALAQLRSTQERRLITVSEIIRRHIPDILSGLTYADGLDVAAHRPSEKRE